MFQNFSNGRNSIMENVWKQKKKKMFGRHCVIVFKKFSIISCINKMF